jgi:hypothetical protein
LIRSFTLASFGQSGTSVKLSSNTSPLDRAIYLSVAALFFGFLVISTPHQVHHFFDRHSQSGHQHSGDHHSRSNDRNAPNTEQTCVFQVVGSRCQSVSASSLPFVALSVLIKSLSVPTAVAGPSVSLSGPLQIRAPPKN